MFYFKEIFYRFLFFFLTILVSVLIFYCYRNFLINIIIVPFIFNDNHSIKYFIYTHPTELIYAISLLIFIVAIIIHVPHFFWSMLDFFKPGLYKTEYKKLKKKTQFFTFFILISNFLAIIYVFPLFWRFFEEWNSFSNNAFKIYLELKFENYFSYLIDFILFINLSVFILFVGYFLVNQIGTVYFFRIKKFLILINILLATFLSPPEIFFQIFFFFILNILLEFVYIILILNIKISTVIY